MKKDELRKLIYSKINELPTLPVIVPKLLNLVENSKSNASDITDVISRDPALTSKILKVANSAYYGFSRKVSGLEMAVPLLGFNMVKSLAISIGVVNSLSTGKKFSNFSQEELWLHCLAVAMAMQEMGKRFRKVKGSGPFFIIGLLHDTGKIVLDQFFHDLFQQAIEESEGLGDTELHRAERRVIGFDHGEIGAMLLTRWKFPDEIINPIAVHHQTQTPEGTNSMDVSMLKIANRLCYRLNIEEEYDSISFEKDKENLELLKMNEKDVDDMKRYLHSIKNEINSFFGAMT